MNCTAEYSKCASWVAVKEVDSAINVQVGVYLRLNDTALAPDPP